MVVCSFGQLQVSWIESGQPCGLQLSYTTKYENLLIDKKIATALLQTLKDNNPFKARTAGCSKKSYSCQYVILYIPLLSIHVFTLVNRIRIHNTENVTVS